MRALLEIYLAINIFISGYLFYQDSNYDKWSKFKSIMEILLWAIYRSLFAIPHYIIMFSLALLYALYFWIDKYKVLEFYFDFYLTRKYYNVDKGVLERVNWQLLNKYQGNTWNDRFWQKFVAKINKRNNYTYTSIKNEE